MNKRQWKKRYKKNSSENLKFFKLIKVGKKYAVKWIDTDYLKGVKL